MTTAEVTKDTVIGEVLRLNPEAGKVIEKYFGSGCFTCPGIEMETIAFGASMHGVDADQVVSEIQAL